MKPNGLAVLVGPFWSAERTRTALGLPDHDALTDLRHRHEVLAVETSDGVWLYPISQFVNNGAGTRVLPGVLAMLTGLAGRDGWAVAVLLETYSPELGVTPLEWARNGGDPEDLRSLAARVAGEWS